MTSCAMVLYLLTALSFVACCILFWLLTMLTSSFSLGCHQWLKVVYAIVIYANIVCIVCYASDGIGWTNFIKLEMLSSRVVCWPWFCRITNTWQSTCPPLKRSASHVYLSDCLFCTGCAQHGALSVALQHRHAFFTQLGAATLCRTGCR